MREQMPDVPWAVRELLIANVVVGNFTPQRAIELARVFAAKSQIVTLDENDNPTRSAS